MRFKSLALTILICASLPDLPAQTSASQNIVQIDATQTVPPPETGFLHLGGKSSNGHDFEINSRYLTLDGKPVLPVMGEFHYSRYPPQYWEEEILKMKNAGVTIVSTYVFWIHHEEVEGQFDWAGQRNLRRFVQICAKHGMYVYLRPGPWDHGEVRNGGLPDWLANQPKIRSNDPAYLAHVARLDGEIGGQVKGLLWKDGGPIIGLQLENEYDSHGPGMGSEHILKLKELAVAAGLEVPLYSVTGWPSLDFPPHEVIPVSGGYPDGFWFGSLTHLPPSMNYLFNLNRKLGDMGATVPSEDPTGNVDLKHDPYFGAEEAGGMAASYHRRPLIKADDIAALALTGIGSGLNLYGYYMYQGGQNPHGRLTTLQESQSTGFPNDLPEYGYDFQAPLGEYGQERESYRKTRMLHLFLNAFGNELAQAVAVGASVEPESAADTSVARVSLRYNGDKGFIFVNNYLRQTAMPERRGFQVKVRFAGSQISVPENPITLPANSYFCLPVNLDMGGVRLRYSTAQLLTKVESANETTYVFFAIDGVPADFSFASDTVKSIEATGARIVRAHSAVSIEDLQPGTDSFVSLTTSTGSRVRILLLTGAQAETASIMKVENSDHLLLSPAAVFSDGSTLHVRSTEVDHLAFKLLPPIHNISSADLQISIDSTSNWSYFQLHRSAASIPWVWTKIADAKPVPPVTMGPFVSWRSGRVAQAPAESEFNTAAEWRLTVKRPLPPGISDLFLKVDYIGDIGRLYLGPELVDDDFYNGRAWQIGLKRYMPDGIILMMNIKVLPLRRDAPIYIDARVKPQFGRNMQLAEAHAAIAPEYEFLVDLKNGQSQ